MAGRGSHFLKRRQGGKQRLLIGGQITTEAQGGSWVNLLLPWKRKLATFTVPLEVSPSALHLSSISSSSTELCPILT